MHVSGESDAQRRARERREHRQAKIAAQGTSRLEAITSLSGRPAPALETASSAPEKATSAPAQIPTPTDQDAPDPQEVDISQHYYQPTSRRLPSSTGASSGESTPLRPAGLGDNVSNDPTLAMMQQMLRGEPPGANDASGGGGDEDAMLKMVQSMLGANGGASAGQTQLQQPTPPSAAYVWRIVHAVFSIGLAVHVALASVFDGSKLSRSTSVLGWTDGGLDSQGKRLFFTFATFEVVLQTTRFFIEKGRLQPGGIMGTLSTLLPEPFAGYVRLTGRYSIIYTTVVSDAMVVVFVLGAIAWWKNMVVS